MSTKEAYKQKIEAEVALVQAKLVVLKAQANNYAADASIKYAKQIDELEQGLVATKAKLKELSEASDDSWEHLKDGMESTWNTLSAAVRNTAAKFS